jgi:ankyrin repeat protein
MWNKFFVILILFCNIGSLLSQDIFEVARSGNKKQLTALLAINKDTVNAINTDGFSPLMIACYRGKTDIAKRLVSNGASIDLISSEGNAFLAAVYQNNSNLSKFLIRKGANINVQGPDGNNGLMYAVLNQNKNLVKYLLKNNASLSLKNLDGQTAYSLSMTLEDKSISVLLSK